MKEFKTVLARTPTETKTAPSVKGCINFIKQAPTTNCWIHVYEAAVAALGEKLC